jgi:hypothetical protein
MPMPGEETGFERVELIHHKTGFLVVKQMFKFMLIYVEFSNKG